MSKYSALELKAMADVVLADHAKGGDKSFLLIIRMSMETQLTPAAVVERIYRYAE